MAGKKEAAKMAKKSVDAKLGQQALGPAAKQFGQALAPLGRDAGEVATLVATRLLGTVRGLVHGYDVVSVWLHEAVTRRLKEVSRDKIAEPNPRVTVPAVQALTYSMNEASIREMFANLVAADMNMDQKAKVHPAFVELIKEMTPSEAKILADMEDGRHIIFKVRLGTGSRFQELARHYTFANDGIGGAECLRGVSNLQRLGLVEERVEWPSLEDLVAREAAVRRRYDHVTAAIAGEELPGDGKRQILIKKAGLFLTPLGHAFVAVCLGGSNSHLHRGDL